MTDGWVAVPRPKRNATWVHYKHGVELRVTSVGGGRFEVALLRGSGPMHSDKPTDVYVKMVEGMKAAARKARWVKENVEDLLRGEERASERVVE